MEIIQEIGSYAGIAAILGLAVLSALYFSQARDVKRLREWAGRAPERGPVGVPAQQQPPAQPRSVTARPIAQPTRPPTRPVPGGTPPPVPRPPGAQGAPATSAAGGVAAAGAAGAAASAAGAGPAVARGPAPATPAAAQVDAGDQPPAEAAQPDHGTRTPPSGDELDITQLDTEIHPPPTAGDEGDSAAAANGTAAAGAGATFEREEVAGAQELDDEPEEVGDDATDPPTGEGYVAQPAIGEGAVDDEPDDYDSELDETAVYGDEDLDAGETGDWRPEDEHSDYPLTDEHAAAPLTPPAGTARPPSPPPPYRRRGAQPATPPGRDSGRILPPYEESRPDGAGASSGRPSATGRRRLLTLIAGAITLAIVVFGALQLVGGDGDSAGGGEDVGLSAGAEDGGEGNGGGNGGAGAVDIDPSQVTVAVLNGTTVPGLAATMGDRVETEGFQLGTVTNNSDQELAESVVFYAPGAEPEAAEVGRRLGIAQREAIDAESQALAGDATVVVVAGADQSQQ